jgi:hypothetical protein
MIKIISTFALKSGYDPEESYQLWIKEHVPYVKKTMHPELKGYIVGRVVHGLSGGEFFGSVQLSYNTLDDAKTAWSRILANPPDEFMKRITDVRRVIIEEKDVM